MSLWQLALFFIGGIVVIQVLRMIESPKNMPSKKRNSAAKNKFSSHAKYNKYKKSSRPKHCNYHAKGEKYELDKRKGDVGEYTINLNVSRLGKGYKQLDNLMLWVNGKTTEIDHVVVSPNGIFVIETKNRAGYMYGQEKEREWTQVLNRHSKYKFPNPIRQNEYHIKALKQNLPGYKHADYFSIIAFTRRATLKAVPKSKDFSYYVVFNSEVAETIEIKRNNRCLSVADVDKIYNILRERNITDPAIIAKHKNRQN